MARCTADRRTFPLPPHTLCRTFSPRVHGPENVPTHPWHLPATPRDRGPQIIRHGHHRRRHHHRAVTPSQYRQTLPCPGNVHNPWECNGRRHTHKHGRHYQHYCIQQCQCPPRYSPLHCGHPPPFVLRGVLIGKLGVLIEKLEKHTLRKCEPHMALLTALLHSRDPRGSNNSRRTGPQENSHFRMKIPAFSAACAATVRTVSRVYLGGPSESTLMTPRTLRHPATGPSLGPPPRRQLKWPVVWAVTNPHTTCLTYGIMFVMICDHQSLKNLESLAAKIDRIQRRLYLLSACVYKLMYRSWGDQMMMLM